MHAGNDDGRVNPALTTERMLGEGVAHTMSFMTDGAPVADGQRVAITTTTLRRAGRPAHAMEQRPMHPRPLSGNRVPTPIDRYRTTERPTMNAADLNLTYLRANARRRELLAEAEYARAVAQATATRRPVGTRTPIAVLRRYAGTALVRAGERLQGAQRREAMSELDLDTASAIGGALRIAR